MASPQRANAHARSRSSGLQKRKMASDTFPSLDGKTMLVAIYGGNKALQPLKKGANRAVKSASSVY